jgi:3-methyladenine DNA glycosylase/8-oxoguanine DNA glycosylase
VKLVLETGGPWDLASTLAGLRFGARDPSARFEPTAMIKAAHTPEGPVTLRVRHRARERQLEVELDGPGSRWLEPRLPGVLGLEDRPDAFVPEHPRLRAAMKRAPGLRLGRVISLGELHVATILQQRVKWVEAANAFARVTAKRALPAPGTDAVVLPLPADAWRRVPSYELAAFGVELKRYTALQVAVRAASKLEALRDDPAALRRTMSSLRGTGVWTTEMVLGFGAGDPDAVPLGDVHLPHEVSKFFEGVPHGSDERMVELLAPYAGHRFRVLRLISR